MHERLFGTPTSFKLYTLLENVAALLPFQSYISALRGYVFLTGRVFVEAAGSITEKFGTSK